LALRDLWLSESYHPRLLRDMADPRALARRSKLYISTSVGAPRAPGGPFAGGEQQDRIYGTVPVPLRPTKSGGVSRGRVCHSVAISTERAQR
jgi:hypothetical protein